jgi:tetratricopeptide (TPR) repeat protein
MTMWELVLDNLPRLVTTVAGAGLVALFTYLYKQGSWTREHKRARFFEEQGDKFAEGQLWDPAIEKYKQAIEIWDKELNRSMMLALNQKLGRAYNRAGNMDGALGALMQCEALWEAIRKAARMHDVYFELSQVYLKKRELDKAGIYIQKAISQLKEQKSPRLPNALAMAARISKDRGRPEEAESYYLQAIEFLDDIGDTLGLGAVYDELGELKASQRHRELAAQYYRHAHDNYEKLGSRRADDIKRKLAELTTTSG